MRWRIGLSLWACASLAWASTVSVTTVSLESTAIAVTQRYPATVEAMQRTALSAGIAGALTEVWVQVGDAVKAGQLIAELDCRDARLARDRASAAVEAAEINLAFAQRQADRIRQLAATNIASEELKDTRVTDVARLDVALETARTALAETGLAVERCRVIAPFAAYVTAKRADQGTRVQIGTPIVELTSQAIEVQARVPLGAIWPDAANLTFQSAMGVAPLGAVLVASTVDSGTGSRLLRFASPERLLPGTPGQLVVADVARALPGDYLVERDGVLGIFVAEDQRARFIPRPEAQLGQPVAVNDLPMTTRLIDAGRFRVRDGDSLEIN